MQNRPSPDTPVADHVTLTKAQRSGLTRLGIETLKDLLYHFPHRYHTVAEIALIRDLEKGKDAVVYGKVAHIKTGKAQRKKIPLAEATISDETGTVRAVWFHQPYIANYLAEGTLVKVAGKLSGNERNPYFTNPEIEAVSSVPYDASHSLFESTDDADETYIPVYPETKEISSRWLFHRIRALLSSDIIEELEDPIPETIRSQYQLPSLRTALIWIHTPKKEADARSARKRFAFQEIFGIQLTRLIQRRQYESQPSFMIPVSEERITEFLSQFSFTPTAAQRQAITDVCTDFTAGKPMTRLLEGDVGSGKTLVAAAAAYAVATTSPNDNRYQRLQVAYMAPTEVLARQHYASFIEYFSSLRTPIALITGSECRVFPSKENPATDTHISRRQLLAWVANGEIPIVIGTHALIQRTVRFRNLAFTIIDEQHRFGIMQRMKLTQKHTEDADTPVPHLLSMTATPIPRTLALTVYGDLDLSVIDEMPAGRKPIHTEVVPPDKRTSVYERLRAELDAGRQAYVICPRIDAPDPQKEGALLAKAVKDEAQRLQTEIFPEYPVAFIHSKMTAKEKEEVMAQFAHGDIAILVATSVVEVGVNVPNATTIIIEGAERFGLAQLHQLRGRVLRSSHQAYCYVFPGTNSTTSHGRLQALADTDNGFALAEKDLEQRGAGELTGNRQWGVSDMGMEALQNMKMVEAARKAAQELLERDPSLTTLPTSFRTSVQSPQGLHFE